MLVVAPFADGGFESAAFQQDRADRTDLRGFVTKVKSSIHQPPRWRVNDQMRTDATAADGEDALAIHIPTRAYTKAAKNAAVEIDEGLGMRGIDGATRIEVREMRSQHPGVVAERLQLAGATGLTPRAHVITFDEKHLQQVPPIPIECIGCALHHLSGGRRGNARCLMASVHGHRAYSTIALWGQIAMVAEVRYVNLIHRSRLHNGLARRKR